MKFLVKKAPEHFLRTVNDEINSLLNRHFDSYFPEAAYLEEMDKFSIPIELKEKKDKYEIKAELPGIKKEDLDIDIDKNYLVLNAKKQEEKETEEDGYKKSEFRYGEYSRTVYFPQDVDIEKMEAELKDGVLKINAPKKQREESNRKKLTIK